MSRNGQVGRYVALVNFCLAKFSSKTKTDVLKNFQ